MRIFTEENANKKNNMNVNYDMIAEKMASMQKGEVPSANSGLINLASANQKNNIRLASTQQEEDKTEELTENRVISAFKIPNKGTCAVCGTPHPCACDMRMAQAADDEVKLGIMKEIRASRRLAMAQHIKIAENKKREEFSKLAAIKQQNAERSEIVNGLEKIAQSLNEGDSMKKKATVTKFKSVDELDSVAKTSFAKWAMKQGWPKEYVQETLTTKKAKTKNPIKTVIANKSIDIETKQMIVTAMIKEGSYTPEQLSHFEEYWLKSVGMPAKWVAGLVKGPKSKMKKSEA